MPSDGWLPTSCPQVHPRADPVLPPPSPGHQHRHQHHRLAGPHPDGPTVRRAPRRGLPRGVRRRCRCLAVEVAGRTCRGRPGVRGSAIEGAIRGGARRAGRERAGRWVSAVRRIGVRGHTSGVRPAAPAGHRRRAVGARRHAAVQGRDRRRRRGPQAPTTSTGRPTRPIYDAILDLYGRGEPADAVTVAAELTRRGELNRVGGRAVPAHADRRRADRGQRRLLRPDRRRAGDPAPAGRGRDQDRPARLRAATAATSTTSSTAPRPRSTRSPSGGSARTTSPSRTSCEPTIDEIEAIAHRGGEHGRRADRLRRPRRADQRPAPRPDDHRRGPARRSASRRWRLDFARVGVDQARHDRASIFSPGDEPAPRSPCACSRPRRGSRCTTCARAR